VKNWQRLCWVGVVVSALTIAAVTSAAQDRPPITEAQAQAVKLAQQYQIPPVPEQGDAVGPFPGPEGSIYYLNRQGLMTFYLPGANAGYLAREGSPLTFHYGFNVTGYYRFSSQGAEPLTDPSVMMPWPHAVAVANAVVARYQREQQSAGQGVASSISQAHVPVTTDSTVLQRLSELSALQHKTTMNVLKNMDSEACTQYYDGVYYLGCW
jgi:hypothetical protein